MSCTQVYSTNLGQVVDIVVSHQAVALKAALVARLMAALVLPAPEHYRPLLRRLAALGTACLEVAMCQSVRVIWSVSMTCCAPRLHRCSRAAEWPLATMASIGQTPWGPSIDHTAEHGPRQKRVALRLQAHS